jgi:hypothetical protein
MTDEDDRLCLSIDRSLGGRDICLQRDCRVLDDGDVVTVLLQGLVDAVPARPIDESAMDEDDRLVRPLACADPDAEIAATPIVIFTFSSSLEC